MLAKLKLWGLGAAAFFALIIGAYLSGRSNAKADVSAKAQKQAVEDLRKVRKIESEADAMPISDVRKRIASRLRD